MTQKTLAAALLLLIVIGLLPLHLVQADGQYLGQTGAIMLTVPGCNATSPVQVPGSADLFINRQPLTAQDQIAGISGPNDCSGSWSSLVLDRLDWTAHSFSIVKPLLDTSIDPRTHRPRAIITGGLMRGAIIRSAYDADIVVYRGQYLVSYECTLEDGRHFGVDGTSSCISIYDPSKQTFDLAHTQVIISGIHVHKGLFYAAAVPALLVSLDRLYIYWSALRIESGKFVGVAVRGAELVPTPNGISVKGSLGRVVHAIDTPSTTQVWRPDPNESMSNTTIDIRALWVSGKSIIAMGSMGGAGCTAPSNTTPGCFRLVIVKSNGPLGEDIFNQAQRVNEAELPTNPQEYTRPARDRSGNYWLCGHFIKPPMNGFSELRPAPGGNFWRDTKKVSALIIFPLTDRSLWPTE